MPPANEHIKARAFLQEMYDDDYFPKHLVEKGRQILLRLCERIELEKPADEAALYKLAHAATEEFNDLGEEFDDSGSELETAAREAIGEEFWFIAKTYGFENADVEELIAPREW